jgi:general stress protein 26
MNTIPAYARLIEAFAGVSIVIFTAIGDDGTPQSRPMVVQEVDHEGCVWFFLGRCSALANDLRNHSHVAVASAEHGQMAYVSVSGIAHPCEDRIKASHLWKEEYLTWFPLGVADPDLLLVRVAAITVECWRGMNHEHFAIPLTGHACAMANA